MKVEAGQYRWLKHKVWNTGTEELGVVRVDKDGGRGTWWISCPSKGLRTFVAAYKLGELANEMEALAWAAR